MTREAIISQVKAKLGEVTEFDSNQVADDTLIDNLLDPGAREILLKVPLHLINPTAFATGTPGKSGVSNTFAVPDDFLRLHSFKCTTWGRVLTDVITDDDYRSLGQHYSITRGSDSKPKLYLTRNNNNKKVLKWYGGNAIEFAYYVKEVTAGPDFQENLVEPLAWQVAGDLLSIMGDEAAQVAYAKVQEFIKDNSL